MHTCIHTCHIPSFSPSEHTDICTHMHAHTLIATSQRKWKGSSYCDCGCLREKKWSVVSECKTRCRLSPNKYMVVSRYMHMRSVGLHLHAHRASTSICTCILASLLRVPACICCICKVSVARWQSCLRHTSEREEGVCGGGRMRERVCARVCTYTYVPTYRRLFWACILSCRFRPAV